MNLFDPITLRSATFRNRLWVAPMCQYSVTARDGVPVDWHHVHLAQFASGGAGLILTEATAVLPEGRISPEDTGIWNDEQRDVWAGIVDAIHARGGAVAVQLAHAGRKASTFSPFADGHGSVPLEEGGWITVAPSAVAFSGYAEPVAMDEAGIARCVEAFSEAARRSVEAGFDAVEIHAAHGYLLHQFLSPLSNVRDDAWGGSLENRARLVIEVVHAVRAAVGELPVLVRFSATDWVEGGLDVEDVAAVSGWVRDAGADFIDVSTGGLVHAKIPVEPGYQVPFARRIREVTGLPVGAVGLITTGTQAQEIVASGLAEVALAGREFLRDPHFPLTAATELGVAVEGLWPVQYDRAR